MLKFYGATPPYSFYPKQPDIGGICPHCKQGSRFNQKTFSIAPELQKVGAKSVVLSYSCDICSGLIPIEWTICGFQEHTILASGGKILFRVIEPYDFENVPEEVKKADEQFKPSA